MTITATRAAAPVTAAAGVGVVMVVRGEPRERVARALAAVAAQQGTDGITVYLAAPREDHATLATLRPGGAVRAVRLVDNPDGARSCGLNRAAAVAGEPVLVRVDARSEIPPGYVAACARRLDDPEIGMVGGVQWPVAPADAGPAAAGIARALRNRWLLGNAAYRRPDAHGPVDTVYLGAYRCDELLDLGGYDERLAANEDYDLAQRYLDAGRTVWLEEGQPVRYEPRADWAGLARQYHAFGEAKVRYWRRTGRGPNARQLLALGGLAGAGVATAALARRPRRLLVLAGAAVAGVAIVDHLADPTERAPLVRARACAASTVIVGAWFTGVVTGALRHRRG